MYAKRRVYVASTTPVRVRIMSYFMSGTGVFDVRCTSDQGTFENSRPSRAAPA
jgi:hypothetical protein